MTGDAASTVYPPSQSVTFVSSKNCIGARWLSSLNLRQEDVPHWEWVGQQGRLPLTGAPSYRRSCAVLAGLLNGLNSSNNTGRLDAKFWQYNTPTSTAQSAQASNTGSLKAIKLASIPYAAVIGRRDILWFVSQRCPQVRQWGNMGPRRTSASQRRCSDAGPQWSTTCALQGGFRQGQRPLAP